MRPYRILGNIQGFVDVVEPTSPLNYCERVYKAPFPKVMSSASHSEQLKLNKKQIEKSKEWKGILSSSGLNAEILVEPQTKNNSKKDIAVKLTPELEEKILKDYKVGFSIMNGMVYIDKENQLRLRRDINDEMLITFLRN